MEGDNNVEQTNHREEKTLSKKKSKLAQLYGNKRLQANVKNQMVNKNINITELSKKAHINIYILTFLLYFPFSKIKLTQSIRICKVLKLKVADIVI